MRRPDERLVAARDHREQPGVDVAAAEHHDRRTLGRGVRRAGQERGDPDGARSLDDELGLLHQHHHRLGDVVLGDDDDVVDPLRDEAKRELAWPLDRDAVRDRQGLRRIDRLARLQRRRKRGDGLGLNADDLDVRAGRT